MPDLNVAVRLTVDNRGFQAGVRAARRETDRLTTSVNRSGQAARLQATGNQAANAAMRRSAATAQQQAAAQNTAADAAARQTSSLRGLTLRLAAYSAATYAVIALTRQVAGTLIENADAYTQLNNRLRLSTDSETELIAVRRELLGVSQRTFTSLTANAELYQRISLASTETGHSQAELLRVTELLNKQVLIGGNNATEAAAGLTQFAQGLASGRLQGDELRSVLENLQGVSEGLITGFRILRERGQIDIDVTRANLRELAADGVLSSRLLLDAVLASGDDTEQKFKSVETTVSGAAQQLGNAFLLLLGHIDELTGASSSLAGSLSQTATDITDNLTETQYGLRQQIRELEEQIENVPRFIRLIPIVDQSYQRQLAALREQLRQLQGPGGNQVEGHAPVLAPPPVRRAGLTAPSAFETLAARPGPTDESRRQAEEAFKAERQRRAAEQRAAEQQDALVARRIRSLDDQIARTQALSEVERLRIQIAGGALGDLSSAEEDLLLQRAAALDAAKEQDRVEQQRQRDAEAAAREQAAAERDRLAAIEDIRHATGDQFAQARAQLETWRRETLATLSSNTAAYEQYADDVEDIVSQRLAAIAREEAETRLRESRHWRDGAKRAFEEYGRDATDAAANVEAVVKNGLQSMEDALVDFVTTGKLNFKDLVDSILADLARLVIRQTITGPLAQALGGVFGGFGGGIGGGVPGGIPNSIAGAPVFHAGGVAGAAGGRRRLVDGRVFDHAYRYHRGGLAGNEVPAILERGERVLSRAETAAYDDMRQAPQVRINIDNRGAPVNAEVRNQRWDGRGLVVDVLLDDVSRRGPFTQGLQRTFGLREQSV